MPEIEIDLKKSLQENASVYFNKSKKFKSKLQGLEKGLKNLRSKIQEVEEKKAFQQNKKIIQKRKLEWFEKMHWFYTMDGMLAIGGRDAKQNEDVFKKFFEKNDLFFHADIQGGSVVILKTENKIPSPGALTEVASFAAIFSKAFQKQTPVDVYSAEFDAVSKTAPSGEFVGMGGFIVGKRQWYKQPSMKVGIGMDSRNRIVSGPASTVSKSALFSLDLAFGDEKKSHVAKKVASLLQKKFPEADIDLDEIIRMLPNGEMKLLQK